MTVLPEISPAPLAVRTLPGKVNLDLKVGDHTCADSLRITARHVETPLLAGIVEAAIADIGELAADVLVVLVALLV